MKIYIYICEYLFLNIFNKVYKRMCFAMNGL